MNVILITLYDVFTLMQLLHYEYRLPYRLPLWLLKELQQSTVVVRLDSIS